MEFTAAGILQGVPFIPSPNFDERPADAMIDLIVVHGISLPPGEFGGDGVEQLFTNSLDYDAHPYFQTLREMRVSAHFFVRRDGRCIQFVPCSKRAWHAGVSSWQGRERCNDFSIGIELEGSDEVPYEPAQYESLSQLVALLRREYPVREVVGHSDIAPGRKTDPGPSFEWTLLRSLLQNA
ncbi:MAG TPA: 1,6-anhydro-N-acetylmuramyl-L-alanine amidase AmpD [Burkholderiales bacterium]|nr:1,6-anhydro-N-acetylmuramyl-L-alanine amidase AmpD [Burkholderiales bacterium]